MANRISAAYRRKCFRRAAAIRAWGRAVAVGIACWVLYTVMGGTDAMKPWLQGVYTFVALGYWWMDVYYGSEQLRRRYQSAAQQRKYLRRGESYTALYGPREKKYEED